MEPRDLLRALMHAEGLNPSSLAQRTNNRTKQPQIHRFLSGEAREPRRSTWQPVAKYFDIPIEAIFDPVVAASTYRQRFGSSGASAASEKGPHVTPAAQSFGVSAGTHIPAAQEGRRQNADLRLPEAVRATLMAYSRLSRVQAELFLRALEEMIDRPDVIDEVHSECMAIIARASGKRLAINA